MSERFRAAISTLTSLGGDAAYANIGVRTSRETLLVELLNAEPRSITRSRSLIMRALRHGFSYFYWKWDRRAVGLYETVTAAIRRWEAEPMTQIGLMCDLGGFLSFFPRFGALRNPAPGSASA